MKTYIALFILVLMAGGCEQKNKAPLPHIRTLFTTQIQLFEQAEEHDLAWIYEEASGQKENPHVIKQALREGMKYDIDSLSLDRFTYYESEKEGLKRQEWVGADTKIEFLTFTTISKGYPITLLELRVTNQEGEMYLLIPESRPIEKFVFFGQEYQPTYVSRLLGLNEAIAQFQERKNM